MTEPSIQLTMSDKANRFGARFIAKAPSAPAKLDRPTPARISCTALIRTLARPLKTPVAASAPKMANTGTVNAPRTLIPK